jgi:hypothetical protein
MSARRRLASGVGVVLNDRKEEFSYSYVWAVAATAGFVFELARVDRNSVDCRLRALDSTHKRAPQIEVQMKCTSSLTIEQNVVKYVLPVNNYDHLRAKVIVPRLLIVVHVPTAPEHWLIPAGEANAQVQHCAYFRSLRGMPATDNETAVTISIERTSVLTRDTLSTLMTKANNREQL